MKIPQKCQLKYTVCLFTTSLRLKLLSVTVPLVIKPENAAL